MAYDYAIQIGGTVIDTIVDHARFMKYTSGMKRGDDLVIPYKHGELFVPDKYFASSDVLLEVFLPSNTHAAAANALSQLAEILSSQSQVAVEQTDPDRGNIRAMVELMTDPTPTQNNLIYMFGLKMASGFWEDVTASNAVSANPPSVTTSGDRPIDDMILTFAGPGFIEYTDSLGVASRITIDAGAGAGTYIVDVGAATVQKAGADQDEFLTVTQPWWMKWPPNQALTLTTDVAVEVDWRNKWS